MEKARDFKPTVIWIYGSSGCGKTRSVFDAHNAKDIWEAPDDLTYWNGYENQEVALFDDFRGTNVKFNTLLKILDRYPYKCNVKGGYKEFNSRIIYITSIQRPEDCYGFLDKNEPLTQLMRRIDEVRKL